ncbi:hypothetical protein B4168_0206 [Anoxybacillus flavithermus]|nr:hypothetical protein B4168_0206 [Anoxybacillus flavithermus]OAO87305.1 hypothetical protein GT23_1316 [Parageobacillus thermoglucosidasius]
MEKGKGKPGEFCHDVYNSRMNAVGEGVIILVLPKDRSSNV